MTKNLRRYLTLLICALSTSVYADGLIYTAQSDTEGLTELYYVHVSGSGLGITVDPRVKLSAPQVSGGGVVIGLPNFGNSSQVLYGANQDDAQKMEIYLVDLATPGTSTKLNAPLSEDQAIDSQGWLPCFDGSKVFYWRRTLSTDTVDLLVVNLNSPGIATKINPDLEDGRKVFGAFAVLDCSTVVYAVQMNSDAHELYVTDLSNPGVASKVDGPPSSADQIIGLLSLTDDGSRAFWVSGSGVFGGTTNLFTVSMSDLENELQLNEDFPISGQITHYDTSGDGSVIVYRAKSDPLLASNLYLTDPTASFRSQVNPNWAEGAIAPFSGFESVILMDGGTTALYNGPKDDADVGEIYETSLDNLQSATKLNGELGDPVFGQSGVSFHEKSRDESLVVYSDGRNLGVVDRSNPGTSTLPFSITEFQAAGLFQASFNSTSHQSNYVATDKVNFDQFGIFESAELHVADPSVADSNVAIQDSLQAGLSIHASFWLASDAPIPASPDSDGDGVPDNQDAFPNDPSESVDTDIDGIGNNADTDDDNDSMPDAYEKDNGLDPLDPTDANTDADGDGFTNLEEFHAGTDLQNADDHPAERKVPIAINILLGEDE